MDISIATPEPRSVVPPFDPNARDRIEQVATALLQLCERLETRLVEAEQRMALVEQQLAEMGMVQRGR